MRDFYRNAVFRVLLLSADAMAAIMAFSFGFVVSILYRHAIGREAHVLATWLNDRGAELGLLMIVMVGVFSFGGLYARSTWESEEVRRIFLATGFLALFDMAFQFMFKEHSSRLWFFIAWPMFAVLSVFLRGALRSLPIVQRMLKTRVLLVGSAFSPDQFEYQLRESQANPVSVIGGVGMNEVAALGTQEMADLISERARALGLSPGRVRVVLAPCAEERTQSRSVALVLEQLGVPFHVTLPEEVPARRGLKVHRIAGLDALLAEYEYPGLKWWETAIKRSFDLILALPALVILGPFLLIIAGLLRRESGSAMFVQSRVGAGGARFDCFKFRSMWPDAEQRLQEMLSSDAAIREEWETHQKLKNDPRITPVGRFLRKTSLDELPQLWNVVRGDMSLVGPRPIIAPEVGGYQADRAYFYSEAFKYYSACRPGLTGLWQVSGRAKTSHEERVRLDRWYVSNWSFWLDMTILFKTVLVVLRARTSS